MNKKMNWQNIINLNERSYDWRMLLSNSMRYGRPLFPRRICITVTDWCNRKCSYCPVGEFGTKRGTIKDSVFDVFVRRLAEIKWNGMASLGGYDEPASHPGIVDLVERLSAGCKTCKPVLWTNGDYLTPELTRKLLAAGLWHFIVTRHEPYTENWDRKILACAGAAGKRMTVRTLPGWAIINQGGLMPDIPFARKHWCHLPSNSLEITIDGVVRMCDADFKLEQPQGNIHHQSLMQVWNGKDYFRKRLKLLFGVAESDACKRCMAGKE